MTIKKEMRVVYNGMKWSIVPTDGVRSAYRASSETTPGTYLVERLDDNRWRARYGYEKSYGRPNIEIGIFTDMSLAALACERHDFTYWSSIRKKGEEKAIFGGSSHVMHYVQDLDESDKDRLLPLIVGDHVMMNGASFASRASFINAKKSQMKQDKNGNMLLTVSLPASSIPLWLLEKGLGGEICLGMADGEDVDNEEWKERGSRAMRRAFSLEADSSFQHWMGVRYDKWNIIRSATAIDSDAVKDAVSETLLRLCGCPSHRHLSFNRDSIMRFERYESEFYSYSAQISEEVIE